jgi:hypothetical protein
MTNEALRLQLWEHWANHLLREMNMQAPEGRHRDEDARNIIARLAKAGAASLDRKSP